MRRNPASDRFARQRCLSHAPRSESGSAVATSLLRSKPSNPTGGLPAWRAVGYPEDTRFVRGKLNFRTFPDQQKTRNLRSDFLKINKKGVRVKTLNQNRKFFWRRETDDFRTPDYWADVPLISACLSCHSLLFRSKEKASILQKAR